MTLVSFLPPRARPFNCNLPTALIVVALLLSGFGRTARAQGTAVMPTVLSNAGTVDSIVSKVNGPVLDVFDGALQIDVTNAKITGGDDRLASPVPWAGILVGSRVIAQVTVPEVIPAVVPPRLPATSVLVFLAHAGSLTGTVQSVNTASDSFMLLFTNVQTNAGTEWSGTKADGTPVKGLGDLSAGMFATATVMTDSTGLTARRVFAYAPPTSRIIAFRGKVEVIGNAQWTIGDHVVQVNAETKIVGDPHVGDLVDVLERVVIVPPGMGMPTPIPIAISITKVTPTPTNDRLVEFDGTVESLPQNPAGLNGFPMGHWTISGKDVVVNGLTKVDAGITKGTAVHVKGVALPMSLFASSNATGPILAIEITKR